METMREWLDSNGVELRKFDCEQHGHAMILSVEFRVEAQADTFARAFNGEIGPSPPSSPEQFGPTGRESVAQQSAILGIAGKDA
jgi:hypothetical protein